MPMVAIQMSRELPASSKARREGRSRRVCICLHEDHARKSIGFAECLTAIGGFAVGRNQIKVDAARPRRSGLQCGMRGPPPRCQARGWRNCRVVALHLYSVRRRPARAVGKGDFGMNYI